MKYIQIIFYLIVVGSLSSQMSLGYLQDAKIAKINGIKVQWLKSEESLMKSISKNKSITRVDNIDGYKLPTKFNIIIRSNKYYLEIISPLGRSIMPLKKKKKYLYGSNKTSYTKFDSFCEDCFPEDSNKFLKCRNNCRITSYSKF